MHQAKRVAKNTGILYGRMLITVFISLYTTRLVLNALGAEDFGLFNLVAGVISMLGFLNNSMTNATQRFISIAQGAGDIQKVKQIFNVSVILHIIIAIILFIFLEVAGYIFFSGTLNIAHDRLFAAKVVYQCMVVSTLFTVVSVPYDAVINAHENMMLFAVLGVVESVLKLLIAICILSFTTDRLILYGVLMALTAILLLFIRRIYCSKKYKECIINFNKFFDKPLIIEMGSFAGWSLLGSATSMIAFWGQGLVLNIFFGTLVNAALGIANQISGQLGVFATNMLKALSPIITKSEGAGNRQTMIKFSMTGSKLSFFLLMIFYIPMLLEMPYILTSWLKDVPTYTTIFCSLLLIKNLVEQFYITLTSSIKAVGKIIKYEIVTSFLLIAPFLTTYLLFTLHYPPYIMYVSVIFFTIILCAVVIYFAYLYCDLPVKTYLGNVVARCLLCFITISLFAYIPHYFITSQLLRLTLVCLTTAVVYFVVIWFIGLNNDEKKLVKILLLPMKNYGQKYFPANKR